MQCPYCRHVNPDDTHFCGKCGSPLSPHGETAAYTPDTMRVFMQDIQPGTVLADRYEVIEVLGRGGMGTVFKVLDRKIKETIALKLIRPEIAMSPATRERFRNELKLARKITHRNVCRMYDLGEDGPLYFITMEHVAGQDLKRMMRMAGQLSPGSAVTIAKQMCEGLAEAHRLGIVHRDLKPQNIMIDPEGRVKIMDFGIARSLYEKGVTVTGVLIGSPEYMSPEQAEAGEVDQRTDVYAVGVILYEMVTGRVPFSGDTPLSIAIKHKHEDPTDPGELNALVPPDLSRVILRCLEKNTRERYQNMEELLGDLSRIEKGIPTVERVIPRRKTLVDRPITVTFKPRRILLPALILCLVVTAGILIGRRWLRPAEPGGGEARPPLKTEKIERDRFVSGVDTPSTSFPEHTIGRRVYVVPTPEIPAEPDRLQHIAVTVPDFIQKLVGTATELSGGDIDELAKIQGLMSFLRIDASGWIRDLAGDKVNPYIETLEKLISSLKKDSPYQEEWREIQATLEEGREAARAGKAEEAEKRFSRAEFQINRLYAKIMTRQRAERIKVSAEKTVRTSTRRDGSPAPLNSLEELLKEAEEFNRNRDYEAAAAFYQLAAEAGSLALRTKGEADYARALGKMVEERRLPLSRLREEGAGEIGSFYDLGRKSESQGRELVLRGRFRDAAELFLQACAFYEKFRLSL